MKHGLQSKTSKCLVDHEECVNSRNMCPETLHPNLEFKPIKQVVKSKSKKLTRNNFKESDATVEVPSKGFQNFEDCMTLVLLETTKFQSVVRRDIH